MKVLNLYAGIGGNRKLWKDVEVTAIELNPKIAEIYKDFWPDDEVIVGDAHKFLLEHYGAGWDFIWSSPPCPSHSKIRNVAGVGSGQEKPIYPDMTLYQEIIFLNQIWRSSGCDFNGKFCVENVIPYYEPLIIPQSCGRHYVWANFTIPSFDVGPVPEVARARAKKLGNYYGFDLSTYSIDQRAILRNCVHPKVGKHIFDSAFRITQNTLDIF